MASHEEIRHGFEVLGREPFLDNPFITVSMERVRLPDGQGILDLPNVKTCDYVNAVALNSKKEALVFVADAADANGGDQWEIVSGRLQKGENPVAIVERKLFQQTGYRSQKWLYLGSYKMAANHHEGIGHFFCAYDVQTTDFSHQSQQSIRWVPLHELRYALLDGRISVLSYAMAISLALLTVS